LNHFFQALKVAVVHIGLNEIGPRPLVDIPQGGHLELALVLRSELCPIRIWVSCRSARKPPTPLSTYAEPDGLAVYPDRIGNNCSNR
jgi:hypothetical protein